MTALTQLVGYKLFAINNERMHPESFTLTDRESRTNIKNGQTIIEARRQLKNAGVIDFKTAKKTPVIGSQSSTGQATGLVCNTAHAKSKDVKTEDLLTISNASANTQEVAKHMDYWETEGGAKLNVLIVSKLAALLEKHTLVDDKLALAKAATAANNPKYGISFDFLLRKLAE